MDPKKLAAYANQGGGGGGKGGPPPDQPEEGGEGKEDEHEEEEKDEGEEGGDRFSALLPLLEANAEQIEEMSDELDAGAIENPDQDLEDEDAQMLKEGIGDLDDDLKNEMKSAFQGGISMDEAHKLADHLEEEDLIKDPDRVAGWLFRVAEVIDSV